MPTSINPDQEKIRQLEASLQMTNSINEDLRETLRINKQSLNEMIKRNMKLSTELEVMKGEQLQTIQVQLKQSNIGRGPQI